MTISTVKITLTGAIKDYVIISYTATNGVLTSITYRERYSYEQ